MADTFSLSATFDKQVYEAGETMTLSVAGKVMSAKTDTLSVLITAGDGSTKTINAGPITINVQEIWAITSIADASGRAWKISADGRGATATA